MISLDACLTPALLPLYDLSGQTVIVIDIFRASSSVCYGIDNGALEIVPVATVEECEAFRGKGFLLAAERDGKVVKGFDFGNSPFSYTRDKVEGKRIVLTTTNGTQATYLAQSAELIVFGSFLNISSLCRLLEDKPKVLLLCAGWKGNFSLEDAVFAGAVCERLAGALLLSDSAVACRLLFRTYRDNLTRVASDSAHSKRLLEPDIEQDVQFCLKEDLCSSVPVLMGKSIVKA